MADPDAVAKVVSFKFYIPDAASKVQITSYRYSAYFIVLSCIAHYARPAE